MSLSSPCPDAGQLKELLVSDLPDKDRSELIEHLDSCSGCQHSLEEIATGGGSWCSAAPSVVTGKPPADSAYWSALRQVENDVATRAETPSPEAEDSKEEVSLDFLSPSDNPEYLGRIGHFSVVDVVGRGGMGVVLNALDKCLQRHVAIKVLSPEFANNEMARKRFCREARAAAAVTHENVVAIHEVDEDESSGLPFLVMQLVSGISLQEHLDRKGPLELKDVLRIGTQTAAGLEAAQAQGLIHRDVKPANILLESDSTHVKLTDFGLARAAEDVKLTQTGFVAGTPLFMAPEQARGEPVDHRADLFSLGSVLYAMCTGKPPFLGSTPFLVLKMVTEELPRPIQEINPDIPDWLVKIINKLHAKQPTDRFQTAGEVAQILGHHLSLVQHPSEIQAVCAMAKAERASARPHGWRTWPFVVLSAVLFLPAAFGLVTFSEVTGLTHLAPSWFHPASVQQEDAGPSPRATLNANVGPIWSTAFSPDGETLAMAIDDGTVKLWDPKAGRVRATLTAHKGPVWTVRFSPDGRLLATASDDGNVKLWDVKTGKESQTLKHPASVRPVAFSPNGKTLATGGRNGILRIWQLEDGKELITIPEAHEGVIMSLAFAPDGNSVASSGSDKLVKVWDAATGQVRLSMSGHVGGVYSVAFSSDSKRLASGSWDKTVRVWDAATGDTLATLHGHTQDVWSVAFSPLGDMIASGSEDRTVKLWDVAAGKELATFKGHGATIYTVVFASDGQTVASGGRDGTVRLWDVVEQGGERRN